MYTEETAAPGFWKSELLLLAGLWLMAAAFIVPPGEQAALNNWLVGAFAANVAIGLAGNRKWERPLAAGAAIWLFMSGFVSTVRDGSAWFPNEIAVGVILIVAAISAHWRLRDDVRHARPLTM
jgi:uncharacterized membrane protein SirB2